MTAGALAIFLGACGVHDWYLDKTKSAKRHVALLVTGVVLIVIKLVLSAILPAITDYNTSSLLVNISVTTRVLGWVLIAADVVWGIIEGILILVQGDAGLMAQGYTVIPKAPTIPDLPTQNPLDIERSSLVETQAEAEAREAQRQAALLAAQQNAAMQQALLQQATQNPALSTENDFASNSSQPAPSPAPSSQQPIQLPPSPTLAEQAANSTVTPQPIVFHSQDIINTVAANRSGQPLSTKNVQDPPLMVQGQPGKSKINPVVLRWLLTGSVLVVAAIVGFFLIKNGIDSSFAAGYRESYRLARELSPRITSEHQSSSCEYALNYVQSTFVDSATYTSYVKDCLALNSGVHQLVEELGKTPAVSLNNEIKTQYLDFSQLYNEAFPVENNAESALALYQIWHSYILAADSLTVDSPDANFQAAADILRESDNKTLSDYGEEWLQKQLEYLQFYRAYWQTSYTDENKEALKAELDTKREELKNWVTDHRPDVTKIERLFVPDTEPMYNSFTKLYDLIKTGYQDHYDYKSGDCDTAGKKVFCK